MNRIPLEKRSRIILASGTFSPYSGRKDTINKNPSPTWPKSPGHLFFTQSGDEVFLHPEGRYCYIAPVGRPKHSCPITKSIGNCKGFVLSVLGNIPDTPEIDSILLRGEREKQITYRAIREAGYDPLTQERLSSSIGENTQSENKNEPGGKRSKLFGFSVTHVIRWFGSVGGTNEQALQIFQPLNNATVLTCMSVGRNKKNADKIIKLDISKKDELLRKIKAV